jgi:hypothetical protein
MRTLCILGGEPLCNENLNDEGDDA